MNIPKIIRAFGDIDDKFIMEMMDAERPSVRRIKLKLILPAAVIGILALGTTVIAMGTSSGLDKMKYSFDRYTGLQTPTVTSDGAVSPAVTDLTPDREFDFTYFEQFGEKIPDPNEFPWLEDYEAFGNEFDTTGELEQGDFRTVAVICDDHYFWAVMQYALPDEAVKALDDIPDGQPPTFRSSHFTNQGGREAGYEGMRPISLEDNILTFTVYSKGYLSLDKKVIIYFHNLGYYPIAGDIQFVTLYETEKYYTIPTGELNKAENYLSETVKYPVGSDEVDMTLELSPFGVFVTYTGRSASSVYSDKYFGSNNMRIYLTDGRIYGSGETYWALSHIIDGKSGFIDNYDDDDPTNDIYHESFPFSKPVDITKIEKISIGGVEFKFSR